MGNKIQNSASVINIFKNLCEFLQNFNNLKTFSTWGSIMKYCMLSCVCAAEM